MVRKEELEYIKKVFSEKPDGFVHYRKFMKTHDLAQFNIIPDENYTGSWWHKIVYCVRPTSQHEKEFNGNPYTNNSSVEAGKGVTVCQCVWEMTGKNTHGALVEYLREIIKAGGVMPVDVKIDDGSIYYLDGAHRVDAYLQLGIDLIPVYINRQKQCWATCWRPGMILEDGTLDMSYDFSNEKIKW